MSGSPLPRPWLLRALELETGPDRDLDRLTREAVRAFRDAVAESWTPEADPAAVRNRLHAYSLRLRNAAPGAPSLAATLERCLACLEEDREAVLGKLDALLAGEEEAMQALVEAAGRLFRPGGRLLTYSHSETVEAVVTRYADRLEIVTVSEGRPLNEGLRFAASLAGMGLPVRLVTEAQLELVIPECDLALVGADRVLPDGSLVGRAGTAVLARLCAAHGVPLYVTVLRSRWVTEGGELARFHREKRPPSQVLPDPPRGVQVINVLNDLTPAALVSGYVTEEGFRPGGAAHVRPEDGE